MKINIISDIHVEFENDHGDAFIESLDPEIADCLVIAGDLGNAATEPTALHKICQRYAPKPVVFVFGNHSFYGSTLTQTVTEMIHVEAYNSNLVWLNSRGTVNGPHREVCGRQFIGCTLWYDAPHRNWSDFTAIKGGPGAWIPAQWQTDVNFLKSNVRENDIVVTHMLPSYQCVAPRWVGYESNGFFVTPMDDVIIDRSPALWLAGHTHDSIDVTIGQTRCVVNPRAYPHERKAGHVFDPSFVIDI